MVLVETPAASPYRLKISPYSSHSLLLWCLPQHGNGRRVLDLGCGAGYLSDLIAARGFVVTGVEKQALPGFPEKVQLIEWDLDRGFPPSAASYDYIVCADVLEHLRDPGELLRSAGRALAPGGILLASLPNSGHLYFRLNVLAGRFPQHDRGLFDRTHVRFFTWDGWRELFTGAGFQLVSVRSAGVPVGLALPRWEGSAPIRLMERISYETARVWKTMFAYQFIVTARPEAL
jgi:SAM-dependent methyltransferase